MAYSSRRPFCHQLLIALGVVGVEPLYDKFRFGVCLAAPRAFAEVMDRRSESVEVLGYACLRWPTLPRLGLRGGDVRAVTAAPDAFAHIALTNPLIHFR